MPTTASGIVYPDATGSTDLWLHFAALANSVETLIQTPPAEAAWINVGSGGGAPAFGTGWSSDAAAGGGPYAPPRYRKLRNGTVVLSGRAATTATGATIFTLPVGYRPAFRLVFPVASTGPPPRVDVLATGVVQIVGTQAAGGLSLDGITFFTN